MSQSDLLKNWKNRAQKATPPAFPVRPESEPARASFGQRRLFLLQQLYPDNPFYQYAHQYSLRGQLNTELLERAIAAVWDRHASLRANFRAADEGILVTEQPTGSFSLQRASVNDATGTDEERTERVNRLADEFALRPFNLADDALFRALLIRTGPDAYELIFSLHHIIGDYGSLRLLEEEVFTNYTQWVAGTTPVRPPLPIQFTDFAHWEHTRQVPDGHLDYWRKRLAGELPLAALPYDHSRPVAPTFAGETHRWGIPPALSDRVRDLARRHGTTPNVVILAALNALLYRYTGQKDLLVGSPVSLRDRKETEALIGFLNETVVLRNTVTRKDSFGDLIRATRTTMEEALENKDVPFERLVEELRPERRGGVPPFFQVMFVYNATTDNEFTVPGLEVYAEPIDLPTAKFDLTLFATDTVNGFVLAFEYATDLFEAETIGALAGHFTVLLRELCAAPEEPVATRDLMDRAEKQRLLVGWNPTFPVPDTEQPPLLTELFARHAGATTAAVTTGQASLTQRELALRSGQLATRLLAAGLAPGTAVGLYCDRSPNLLAGILGILRAGGAYVPLDPEYPQERIDYILTDSGATLVVHPEELSPTLPSGAHSVLIPTGDARDTVVDLPTIDRHQNAYLIYTSGSTGRPKGIAITHDNLARSTDARLRFFEHRPDAFLLLSSFSFDSSVAGIFWCVATGAKLVLSARRAEQDPAGLGRLIRSEGVTHTLLLPSLYQLVLEFADPADLAPLRTVMVAGEACSATLVERHYAVLPGTGLVNEYGPTEGTVWSTAHNIVVADARTGVPIGRPVHGMGHYILDGNQQLLPVGVAGELCLSGKQLAKGYHGRPDLTAATFLPNPFAPAERLYRTGDLVRYRKDGVIDFLGRRDQQVKIRGHRIELTEISNVLTGLADVREAVTLARRHNDEDRLVSYFLPEQKLDGSTKDELTQRLLRVLKQRLPEYMVPSMLLALDEFPRLPNGKIDRRKLPEGEWRVIDHAAYAPPQGKTEETLATLWAKVLRLDQVGRHDNFFEIGGDSLKSIRIIAGAAKAGLTVAPHQLFNHQTVAELAAALERPAETASEEATYEAAVLLRKGGDKTPLFCLHSGGGHVFFYQQLAQRLDGSRSVYAIQPKGLSGEEDLPQSMPEMAANYIEALRAVQPTGPYLLLGTCFSNALAVEMATQLTAAGQKMMPLLIVDSGTGTYLRPDAEFDTGSRVGNLVRMVKQGRWDKITRRLRVRGILGYRQVASQLDEQRRNLYGTIGALNDIYAAYEWPTYPGEVILIRSTEFAGQPSKDHHVTRWRSLAGDVKVYVTEGEHLTMFQEPAVSGLAEKIDACLP